MKPSVLIAVVRYRRDIVKAIEFYKLQNGHYPSNLDALGEDIKTQAKLQRNGLSSLGEIHYELVADGITYYLLVIGPDGKPFSSDDILPNISEQEMRKIGYRVKH